MSEPPPIKGGGEPWLWPWPDRQPVRVDRSRLHLRRCSWCGNDVPELAWRGDSAGEHIIYVADPNGISMEIVHTDGRQARTAGSSRLGASPEGGTVSERIVVEATGQARIEGAPDLPDLWGDLSRLVWQDLDPLWSPYLARVRAEILDPTRVVRIVTTC